MINKFLNKFNLAVILLAMAFAMDAQGQHFKTDSIYCYYVNFNRTDYTQDKTIPVYTYVSDIVLYRPDDALKRFAKFSIAAGEATADDGFTFIMRDKQQYDKSHEPGYSYIDRNERIHITKKQPFQLIGSLLMIFPKFWKNQNPVKTTLLVQD